MKASNAVSASALVSAIQISCNARLAFGCWLFGSLASTLAVLCTQQRCSRVVGQTSPAAFQKPSAPSAIISSGCDVEPAPLQIEQQVAPVVRTFPCAIGETDEFLLALRRRADDDEDALLVVFEAGLQVNAVRPDVDVALGREVALVPQRMIVLPAVLQPPIADADSPAASLPSSAASASEKSPVEMPLRYRIGNSVSIDFERRM